MKKPVSRTKVEMERLFEQDIKIAGELAKEKQRQFLDEKRRQLLRENTQELRELEVKLRSAYISKCLKSQIAEKEAIKYNETLLKKQEDALLRQATEQDDEVIRAEQEKELKRKESLKKDLQEQIAFTQQEKSKRYEEFLREKKVLDEIAHKIHEEQLEEMRQELEKKARYKSDIEEFLRIQKAWKKQQEKDMAEENERLRKYFEEKELHSKAMDEKRHNEFAIREEISNRIGQKISKAMEEKHIREKVLTELYAAEKEASEEEKFRKQIEEQLRRRIQLREDLDKHKEEMIIRKNREQNEDKEFYQEQMRVLAERDRIDQMSNEKRRRKIIEHRNELQKCLEERKLKRVEEVKKLLKQRQLEIQEEKTRQQLIEEERINLLKEHIENLLGHLPPGILKESDKEFLTLTNQN